MKKNSCPNCGLNDFIFKEGFAICQYCNSKFVLEKDDLPIKGSNISLQYDISILLQKCKNDPKNAKKYAGLILDIDPTNTEAKKYL